MEKYIRLYIRKYGVWDVRFTVILLDDKFHPPTSYLHWGRGIKYCNKGAIGPKRNLACHLHINLGQKNNKYG